MKLEGMVDRDRTLDNVVDKLQERIWRLEARLEKLERENEERKEDDRGNRYDPACG